MLTLTLREPERGGLLTRTVFPTIPPRVDYELTSLVRRLFEPVKALSSWAERHREEIQTTRDRFDAQKRRAPERATARTRAAQETK